MTHQYLSHTASNGIRYIHLPTQRVIAHAMVLINTGSRDEKKHEHGLAHFIEHLMFKGTRKRNSYQILNRIESVGGDLDAFTTKEDTCIIASFLPQYFERSLELLSDILFNSTFPEHHIQLEKNVVTDEIISYYDNPYELIYDDFEELIYDGHPLGRNILGTKESIQVFDSKMLSDFCLRTYNTNQMVVCTAGNLSWEKGIKLFEKYFSSQLPLLRNWKRKHFTNYIPREKIIHKQTHQTHAMLGSLAYSFNHKNRLGLHLLNNILGTGSTSRLNMTLRERNGLVYFIESAYTTYSDSGVIYIYFGTEKNKVTKTIRLIKEELKKLREMPLSPMQLNKAKQQFYGQLAQSYDNQESYAINMAKSFLVYKKIDSLEQILEELNKITSEDIQQIANELLDEEKLSLLIYE
ncbi:MAG: insulinase family protein [Bacteroidales bacterium]|nr:insulinase family protein [Bacteroidales bacterium]